MLKDDETLTTISTITHKQKKTVAELPSNLRSLIYQYSSLETLLTIIAKLSKEERFNIQAGSDC